MKEKLVEVINLSKYFKVDKNKILKAVDHVTFDIYKGETIGLVGESGCGKSTTGRLLIQLYEATSGDILFEGEKINKKKSAQVQKKLKRKIQMIFQDPYSSLNPRMTVSEIIGEGMVVHNLASNYAERMTRIYKLMEKVGLHREHANRYPHEFSGGQRQRIGIARALAIEPDFIIADEPISALDVSIQAQVIRLMQQLQKENQLTYLFITHDLSMVKYISDRIGVMYLGNLVELAESEQLYKEPLHPYTRALLSAIPVPDPDIERRKERIVLQGEITSPINPPAGCRFASRCPEAIGICETIEPNWVNRGNKHWVACHLYESPKCTKRA